MAEAVAIVSVISGAAVAITVPFISSRLEQRRIRYQEDAERTVELRALLDEAALHLATVRESVAGELDSLGDARQAASILYTHLDPMQAQVRFDAVRLRMRLGDHPIVVAHQDAEHALSGVTAPLHAIPDSDLPETHWRNVAEQGFAELRDHVDCFIVACGELLRINTAARGTYDRADGPVPPKAGRSSRSKRPMDSL